MTLNMHAGRLAAFAVCVWMLGAAAALADPGQVGSEPQPDPVIARDTADAGDPTDSVLANSNALSEGVALDVVVGAPDTDAATPYQHFTDGEGAPK